MGVIHFARNFSAAFEERRDNLADINEPNLNASEIQVWLDMGGIQY